MLSHTNSTLVAVMRRDDAPEGYYPKFRTIALFETATRFYGKRYYISAMPNGCSKTWLTDEEAHRMFNIVLDLSSIK